MPFAKLHNVAFLATLLSVAYLIKCEEDSFTKPLALLLNSRDRLLKKTNTIPSFVETMRELQRNAKAFFEAPLTNPEKRENSVMLKTAIEQEQIHAKPQTNYLSDSLADDYKTRFTDGIWSELTYSISLNRGSTYAFPFSSLCRGIPSGLLRTRSSYNKKEISMKDVCTNLNSCSRLNYPAYMTKDAWYKYESTMTEGGYRKSAFGSYGGGFGGGGYFGGYGGGGYGGGGYGGGPISSFSPTRTIWKNREGKAWYYVKTNVNGVGFASSYTDEILRYEADVRQACDSNKKCNLDEAIPIMTSIF